LKERSGLIPTVVAVVSFSIPFTLLIPQYLDQQHSSTNPKNEYDRN
jgi:hypothetical protein